MRRLVVACAVLIALAVALPLALTGGGHKHRTPQQLNGHQSHAQKVAKTRAAVHDLKVIAKPHSPRFRAQVCDRLPEGVGHLGVCAKAPAYGPQGIAPATVRVTVLSGALGIDTSHWDHCGSALVGPRYWIVAVGDGTYIDPCAGPLYASLRRAGLPRSTYYFVRQYLGATWSADHYAALVRQMGATDSLVPVNDAEAISSCAWIHTFDNRLKADLGVPRVIDYDGRGLWPGCSGNGNAAWTAAYGPFGQRLSGGGWVNYVMQQFTDGHVGPYPHCLAVCGDVNIATASFASIAVKQAPVSPPIALDFWQRCSRLDAITYWKLHGGRGHVSSAQHQQAVRIRKWLARNRIGCSAQPRSYPYRLPFRAGALA